MKTLHKVNDRYVALAMKQYGGSFVMRLGDAALHADAENLQIIKNAFPTIWEFYTRAVKDDLIDMAQELKFDQAQRAYDAQMPPDERNCQEDGHLWRKIRSSPNKISDVELDEVTLYRCLRCGAEELQ